MVKKELDKTNPKNTDTSTNSQISVAQDFLPFKTIKDNVIDLGNHDYRMIIECSSVNYHLRTDNEKEIIEMSFQRLINSINHPITFFIQTKTMDNTEMVENMKDELTELIKEIPQMEEYANSYYMEMQGLASHIGNNKQKKKYIIIPFNEAIALEKLNDAEKYEYSIEELRGRVIRIIDGLGPVGVIGKILDTTELVELVYNTYHKGEPSHYKDITSGEFLTPIVKGINREQNITDDQRVESILYEAQMRLRNEVTTKDIPEYMIRDYEEIINKLDKLRDDAGGNFKG